MDNVFNAAVSIALPTNQQEFNVTSSNLQWVISAYTLTFVLCTGLLWLSIWTIAVGVGETFNQLAIFRAFQGIGAAMTVPSSLGIIGSYYVGKDQSRALSVFASCGALGFCGGLIFGFFVLPKDRKEGGARPRLDYMGAALSTAGLVLLSFVLSSGGVQGWNRGFIIGLLVTSVVLLIGFVFVEKKVSNPIMPLSLWKLPHFPLLWLSAFAVYGSYQTTLYYAVLAAQRVSHLSAKQTAVCFPPMGGCGLILTMLLGYLIDIVSPRMLLFFGMSMAVVAPIPTSVGMHENMSFWTGLLPTSILGIAGISLSWVTVSTVMLSLVPVNVKSFCGGMINTAFQFGAAVALAIAAAVTQELDIKHGHGVVQEYRTGLWCSAVTAGVGLLFSVLSLLGPVMKWLRQLN
ncbi:MFS general substrate transporter [Aspergillus welwitschiae]|uniref:MFS general substrate transporter n=1 Tax=Aspergillus welwitschiae TaxID=1341132 RepID=A0A3F3QBF1_9EURO|nr:MFS general substrate transporter [Aspergillus welwitschiae]RDH36459.1 MFS general substrate transporter [Aspergillus welwitschiae]